MDSGLQAEIKQGKPFGSAEEEAYLNVLRSAAVLEHAFAEAAKPFGITATQYNALRILRGAGGEGLCRRELRDRMIRPVPDTTRLLDRMEQSGWVTRCREGQDRRFVTAQITEAGLDLLDRMDQPLAETHRRQLGHLSATELRNLSALLVKARARSQ